MSSGASEAPPRSKRSSTGSTTGSRPTARLRPLFAGDLAKGREAQKRFFVEWLGGEGGYSSTTHLPLKHRHDLLPITPVLAGKWLAHFRDALGIAVTDVDARRVIYEKVQALGLALVNESEPHTALRARVARGVFALQARRPFD